MQQLNGQTGATKDGNDCDLDSNQQRSTNQSAAANQTINFREFTLQWKEGDTVKVIHEQLGLG